MKEVVEVVEYVGYPEFITVSIAIIGLVITGFTIMFVKIGKIGERVTTTENQNLNDIKNVDNIWEELKVMNTKIDEIDKHREQNVLQFTNAINSLDKTLGKMEVTLERMDKRFEAQDKAIDELKRSHNGN